MPKITSVCLTCSKSFQGRHSRSKYCSQKCFNATREKRRPARFWSKVRRVEDESSCWEWMGAKSKRGYGYVGGYPHFKLAHRISYALTYGPFDPVLNVLHRCDNTSCVRPDHLFLGTGTDNMRDMMIKERHRDRLTAADVREIRIAASQGETLTHISQRFKVCVATISMAVHRITWKHVT